MLSTHTRNSRCSIGIRVSHHLSHLLRTLIDILLASLCCHRKIWQKKQWQRWEPNESSATWNCDDVTCSVRFNNIASKICSEPALFLTITCRSPCACTNWHFMNNKWMKMVRVVIHGIIDHEKCVFSFLKTIKCAPFHVRTECTNQMPHPKHTHVHENH